MTRLPCYLEVGSGERSLYLSALCDSEEILRHKTGSLCVILYEQFGLIHN